MLSSNLPQILDGPTPGPLMRRTLKKEASPAQEGGLKSAGTMPKSSPRRNAMNGKYRPFLTVQAPVFAGYFESLVYCRPIEPSQSGIGRAEEASKP
jgi:hypothetical protein